VIAVPLVVNFSGCR